MRCFRSEQIRIVETPVRAPRASGIAERFVRTVRAVCLDRLLILNRRQLERRLRVYIGHYNRQRPRRALELRPPEPKKRQAKSTAPRSAAATGSAGSRRDTTEPPPEPRHEYWRPSGALGNLPEPEGAVP